MALIVFNFNFWGHFWRGKGRGRHLRVWDLKTRPKSWPTLGSFWVTCYLKIVFPNFQTLFPNFQTLVQAFQFLKHDFDPWVGCDGLDIYQQLKDGFGSMRAILPI